MTRKINHQASAPAPGTAAHAITITHEGPTSGPAFAFGGGHRARCSCGWSSDCYSQLSDTQRAIDVHQRRSKREAFEVLIGRSSIGSAIADIKQRGLDAHLADLERGMRPCHPKKAKRATKKLSPEEQSFMRGFGAALASLWRSQYGGQGVRQLVTGQLVRQLIKQNNFTPASFKDVGMLDADLSAIWEAVEQ